MDKVDEMRETKLPRGKMPKTRRAIDFVCACIIRLPIYAVIIAVIAVIAFFIAYVQNPETALNFLRLFGANI